MGITNERKLELRSRSRKHELRGELAEQFLNSSSVFITQYQGLSMGDLTELRTELRKCDSRFRIVKNRVVKKALEQDASELAELSDQFTGATAVVFCKGDPAQAAKAMVDFKKTHPDLVIKKGRVDNNIVSAKEVEQIAALPSREELLGKIVGSLVSPHRAILGCVQALPREILGLVNALKETKS